MNKFTKILTSTVIASAIILSSSPVSAMTISTTIDCGPGYTCKEEFQFSKAVRNGSNLSIEGRTRMVENGTASEWFADGIYLHDYFNKSSYRSFSDSIVNQLGSAGLLPKTDVESAPAPAPKPEPKPEPKPTPKPEPKPEPKPTPAPKPDPKPTPAPTPKPESKPSNSTASNNNSSTSNTSSGSSSNSTSTNKSSSSNNNTSSGGTTSSNKKTNSSTSSNSSSSNTKASTATSGTTTASASVTSNEKMDAETVEDKDNDVVEKEMNEDSENKTQEEEKEVIMLNDNNIEETLSQFEEREEGYTLVDETLIKELVESDSEKHEELLSELDEDTLTELYHFISNLDIENSEYKEQLLNTIEIVADKNEFALDINEIEDRFKEDEDTEESSEEVVIEASEDEEEKVGFFKKIFASIGSFFSGLFS